jgi:hypothetical protein
MASPMPDFEDLDVVDPPFWAELGAAETELHRQDALWGQQDHPLLGYNAEARRLSFEALAEHQKEVNDARAERGACDWAGILEEEVYEALGEVDPEKQIEELVQVAAVALNAARSIRRNTRKEAA